MINLIDRALAIAAATLEEAFRSHDSEHPCPMMPGELLRYVPPVDGEVA